MATLDEGILQSIANSNVKAMAELGVQMTLGHQNRVNVISETALGRTIDKLNTTDVPEGLGIAAASRGDLTKVVAELGQITAALGQFTKTLTQTPPVSE